jgi:predicted kinase
MCYKRMMQGMKRRRRRKPNRPAASQGEQPAPLQPNYPEEMESAPDNEDDGSGEQPIQSDSESSRKEAAPQKPGRRRRRGGRGRRQGGEPAQPAVSTSGEAESEPSSSEAAAQDYAPAVQPAHAHKRQPKGTVVLTIGLPGSGKTSWFRRRAITPLSSDLLRMMLFDDIAEQRYQDLVFSTLRYLLRARMIARMPWNYVDATNLSPRERRGWIKMAQEFGYEVQAVFFDVPVDVCAERNHRRGRIVPEDVMQRMAQKLRPPTFEEGFSKITVVRVKKHARSEPDNVVQTEEESPGPDKENY